MSATARAREARVFAALGDRTRLRIVAQLSAGGRHSIASLTSGGRLTRQAVTKHLRVLERARIARGARDGRESLFELNPVVLDEAGRYLTAVSAQWDDALARLKSFVER